MRSRFEPGARAHVGAALLLLLAGGALSDDFRSFPQEAEGDIHFRADGAILLDDQLDEEIFFYIALPEGELACVPVTGQEGEWMQVTAFLGYLVGEKTPRVRMSTKLDVPCAGAEGEVVFARRVMSLHAALRDGYRDFEIRIEDRNRTRRELLDRMAGEACFGELRGHLPGPARRPDWALGGPLFLWGLNQAPSRGVEGSYLLGPAEELRQILDANPARTYGLFKPEVSVYFELYGQGGRQVTVRLAVTNRSDQLTVYEDREDVRPPAERCGLVRVLDVSRLAAGSYGLTLEVSSGETGERAAIEGDFEIFWDPAAWQQSHQHREEEARVLLDHDEWSHFLRLEPGRQEAAMESLWADTEGSSQRWNPGELKELFRERLAVADARYGGTGRGSLSDRGRVYVHFGEPDEVHRELAPQLKDRIYYFLEREIDDQEAAETGGRPLRHPLDDSAYEVWYYMDRQNALSRDAFPVRGQGLRFIFVDELNTGDYRLIHSNLFGGFD